MRLRAGSHWLFPLMLATAVIMGPLLSAGCGGGSSSAPPRPTATPTPTGSSTPTPTPTATPTAPQTLIGSVLWAPRSRQTNDSGQVNGPSSALSVTFTVRGAASGGGDIVFGGDRDPKLGSGGTQLYNSGSQKALPGNYPVNVRFFSLTGGQGTLVGTADTPATILADGSLTAKFTTITTITAVDIPADQVLTIGQTKVLNSVTGENALLYTPKDENGNVVAITPGSAILTLVNVDSTVPGQPSASVQGDSITGLAPRRATIRVTIDYKDSPETAVLVRSNAQIAVSPNAANLSLLESQTFTATVSNDNPTVGGVTWSVLEGDTNGTIDQNGVFKSTRNEGTFTVRALSKYDPNVFKDIKVTVASAVAVTITPSEAQNVSFKGGQVKFSATVARVPEGEDSGVTWSVNGGDVNGTITADGLYTSGAKTGTFTVRATSNFDNRKSATVQINVASLVRIDVAPNPATVSIKDKLQFAATVTGVPGGQDNGVTWSVEGGAVNGSIDQTGLYTSTANATPDGKPIFVIVTSKFDPDYSVRIPVTVQDLVQIVVTPNPATVAFRTAQIFTAQVTGVPTGADLGVTWTVADTTLGTIDANTGVFTAKGKTGTTTITATGKFSGKKGTAAVTVASPLTGITIDPDGTRDNPVKLPINAQRQFTAIVAGVPAGQDAGVTWSIVSPGTGTITQSGVYTAPAVRQDALVEIRAVSKYDPTFAAKSVFVKIESGNIDVIVN